MAFHIFVACFLTNKILKLSTRELFPIIITLYSVLLMIYSEATFQDFITVCEVLSEFHLANHILKSDQPLWTCILYPLLQSNNKLKWPIWNLFQGSILLYDDEYFPYIIFLKLFVRFAIYRKIHVCLDTYYLICINYWLMLFKLAENLNDFLHEYVNYTGLLKVATQMNN